LLAGAEESHEESQEAGVRTGLHPNTSLECYHIALFGVIKTVITKIIKTGRAKTK
jgi:hypothetical protein